mgnify:CR=1 FL=1
MTILKAEFILIIGRIPAQVKNYLVGLDILDDPDLHNKQIRKYETNGNDLLAVMSDMKF